MNINKHYFAVVGTILFVVSIIVFTAMVPPSIDRLWSILVLLFLVYSSTAGVLYVLLGLFRRNSNRSNVFFALLFGCLPPILLLLVSIRQATILDIAIILSTVSLILWYASYKK